uniref:Chromo domain-containing protein n=1 Tax=Phytophthora ramorum TaxID=164328 RepID=H3H8J5_PHYRM
MASRSVAAPAAAPVAAQPAVLAVPAALPEVSPGDPPFSGSPTSSPPRSATTAETGVELDSDEEALWEALVLAGRPAMQTMPTAPSNVAIPELFDTVAVPAPPTNLRERIFELLVEGSDYDSDKFDDSQHDEQKEDVPADQWLFDSDDDDEDRPMLSRLRRGDETAAWHPPLPPASAVHPSNGQENCYDPEAEWDYSKPCEVVRLLDVHGEVPHRCYLVEWKCTPLQRSREWMEKLDKPWIREMMQRVGDWKASGPKRVFTRGNKKKRDNASAAGTCFMDGL